MLGKLFVQRRKNGTCIDKPKAEEADIYIDESGIAQAFQNNYIFAEMTSCRIKFVSANGILFTGVEDPTGQRTKLFYQEWWFIPGAQKEI